MTEQQQTNEPTEGRSELSGLVRQIELGKPWLCECGKEHELGYYVAAHWDDLLTHSCDCGRKHTLKSGELTLINSGS